LPCAYGNPLQFYPYSAIRFFYPPQGSGLINSVARNKLQFALKVDNPQPGVVYVKRGVMVWLPQNGLAGNGTVVNTVNLMVKGGAGRPVVYSPAWIMEARGGYGRLDVVDSGAYLNLAGVSESEENNYGAKVIGAGTSVGISFGVGASGAAEAFRVRFHLRQGDPAHAYVRRPAPSTVQVPWDVPFEIYHSSDPNWEFGADAPGVYVIEQVTSVLIGGQDIVVDREYVTVTVVDFTKLQLSSTETPPRVIEDTTLLDEPQAAANTLYLFEDSSGFAALNIQGWWEPVTFDSANFKWVIQTVDDSSGTPSSRWESGFGNFTGNPAVSIFNGNTAASEREFKVTGWYDGNADGVFDEGEPFRRLFVTILKVELDATDLDGAVADVTEETTGAYVLWNVDNDDASDNTVGALKRSGADYLQTGVAKVTGEDDLKSLAMSFQPGISQGSVVLNIANANATIWKDAEKGSANLVLAGPGDKTWNLSDAGQKADFLSLCTSLWVEGVDGGTCDIKLSYKDTSGTEIYSDKVKYTFIAADCGRQPKTDTNERDDAKTTFPGLIHCEWSITAEATPVYNCIAWSVGESTTWYNPDDIDRDFGDNDGTIDDSDMDAFYLAKKGWTPTATGAGDAEAMYFSGYHGAKKKGCACGAGKWIMFESKCGQWVRMEHVWNQLNGILYGAPTRFYK
jgi:hypothetical protein